MNYERIAILGRVANDPEVKTTSSGKRVCNFSVAVNAGWGDNKKTVYYKIATWDKTAEACGNYLTKGQTVFVEGTPGVDAYIGKDGEARAQMTITASGVQFGDKRTQGEREPGKTDDRPQEPPASYQPAPPQRETRPQSSGSTDDLPF